MATALLRSLRLRVAAALRGAGDAADAAGTAAAADAGWTPAAQRAVCDALAVPSFQAAQDVVNALAMSECAYTAHEIGPPAAAAALARLRAAFPPGLLTVDALQPSLPSVRHRYVLGGAPGVLMVGFMGTSDARDAVADANLLQEALWGEESGGAGGTARAPAVHRGFLARARGVPVDVLASLATARGARLVMTGHSLGGAVAQLVTLRLLKGGAPLPVSCVAFAAPALGNAALAADVAARGWEDRFYNLAFADDLVPRVLADVDAATAGPSTVPAATVSHAPFVPPSPAAVDVSTADAAPRGGASDGGRWAWPATLLPPAATAWWSSATASAAAAVPSYAHFGQNVTPALPAGAAAPARPPPRPPPPAASSPAEAASLTLRLASLAAALTPDAASLDAALPSLAAHRVSTYRDRVAALLAAAAGDGAPAHGPPPPRTGLLSRDLAPSLDLAAASARLPMLPPPAADAPSPLLSTLAPASAWASVRRAADAMAARARGAGGAPPPPEPSTAPVVVAVRGGGLATARSARLSAPGPAWCPAVITERPPLDGGGGGGDGDAVVVARVPVASLRAAAADGGGLALWLRSDFDEAAVDVAPVLPCLYIVAGDAGVPAGLASGRGGGAAAAAPTVGPRAARAAAVVDGVAVVDAGRLAGGRPAAQAAAVAALLGGGPAWATLAARLPRGAARWLPARVAGARAGAVAGATRPPHAADAPSVVAVAHSAPPEAGAMVEAASAAASARALVLPLIVAPSPAAAAAIQAALPAAYGEAAAVLDAVTLAGGAGAHAVVAAAAPALDRVAKAGAAPRAKL